MKRDIHKLSAWIEKTVKEGLAEERAVFEWKLAQQAAMSSNVAPVDAPVKR